MIAPSNAETAKSRRTLRTSGRLASALISVPATKPSCTASVSHDVVAGAEVPFGRDARRDRGRGEPERHAEQLGQAGEDAERAFASSREA